MGLIKKINQNSGYTPSGKISWSTKLISEFLGTIFLSWMIGILGVTFGGLKFEVILSGGLSRGVSKLIIGLWVAIDVFLCLAIFSRWSCDLNPAVTTYRILSKQNSLKYGLSKISIQILGGLVGGLCIWSTQVFSGLVSSSAADQVIRTTKDARAAYAVMPDHALEVSRAASALNLNVQDLINNEILWNSSNTLTDEKLHLPDFNIVREFRELQPWSAFTTNLNVHKINNRIWDSSIGLLGEFIGVFILLWPIFTKELKSPLVKDLVLVAVVATGVAALLEINTVAWNPARLLATNWIYDLLKPGTNAMTIFPFYVIGQLLAPFALFYSQRLMKKANLRWENWLKIGKVNDISQHANESKLDNIHNKNANNNEKNKKK